MGSHQGRGSLSSFLLSCPRGLYLLLSRQLFSFTSTEEMSMILINAGRLSGLWKGDYHTFERDLVKYI